MTLTISTQLLSLNFLANKALLWEMRDMREKRAKRAA
jgi:hypothetical protein